MLKAARKLKEEYRSKGRKFRMCFVDLEKAFDQGKC